MTSWIKLKSSDPTDLCEALGLFDQQVGHDRTGVTGRFGTIHISCGPTRWMMEKLTIVTSGMVTSVPTDWARSNACCKPNPDSSARWYEAWITGPSGDRVTVGHADFAQAGAGGADRTQLPRSSPRPVARSGSPAVRKGIRRFFPGRAQLFESIVHRRHLSCFTVRVGDCCGLSAPTLIATSLIVDPAEIGLPGEATAWTGRASMAFGVQRLFSIDLETALDPSRNHCQLKEPFPKSTYQSVTTRIGSTEQPILISRRLYASAISWSIGRKVDHETRHTGCADRQMMDYQLVIVVAADR